MKTTLAKFSLPATRHSSRHGSEQPDQLLVVKTRRHELGARHFLVVVHVHPLEDGLRAHL